MAKTEIKMHLPKIDDLFSTQKERDEDNLEKVIDISIDDIVDFPKHPFKVIDNDEMKQMVDSIKENGILVPALVRKKDNKYEMISGHRRKFASKEVGLETIPCIIRDLTDDEATIIMVDSNMQREKILPSEKAFAYKMKMEALNHQGKETSRPMVEKLNSAEIIGKENNESGRQVQRYIRLTELIPQILQMVDSEKISLRPAVEISYLTKDEQKMLLDVMEQFVCTPSLEQAIKIKNLSKDKNLYREYMEEILEQEKPNQTPKLRVSMNRLKNVLPITLRNDREREEYVIKAVEFYDRYQKRKKEKEQER
ncbi:MAG: ParB/RepB/Spo0J family partition protein [Firmicutes bacterium]|nr:ParB/RepB/Spo0J family partition protein [Bacillota bacterium]